MEDDCTIINIFSLPVKNQKLKRKRNDIEGVQMKLFEISCAQSKNVEKAMALMHL